jgi:2-methylisocitrate lyase-like PEP mutase family enzyme
MSTPPTRILRDLIDRPEIIRSLAPHDAFTARIMQDAGVELLFLGGLGVSASTLGLPDVGLLTMTEMAEAVRRISSCLSVPLIADGDTGHGDVHNVARTVREFERAGASGILLEDQAHPKRCGHFAGK